MGVESMVLNLACTIKRSLWQLGYAKELRAAVINHMFDDWGAKHMEWSNKYLYDILRPNSHCLESRCDPPYVQSAVRGR